MKKIINLFKEFPELKTLIFSVFLASLLLFLRITGYKTSQILIVVLIPAVILLVLFLLKRLFRK